MEESKAMATGCSRETLEKLQEQIIRLKIFGKMGKKYFDYQYLLDSYNLDFDIMDLWLDLILETVNELDGLVNFAEKE